MKFPKFSGLLIFSSQLSKSHRTHPRTSKFSVILFGGLGWGYKAPGRAQREFCPSRFGRKRGDLLAAAASPLAAFSSKFFPDWSIGILFERDRPRRAEQGWENSMVV